jgi:demethylmenaquinone methyltransferase / 2-methoxy-6-polyprenyl-1,4-benzoquinol methylase
MKDVLPYPSAQLDKKQQVSEMFNRIAFTYDFLNHFLSAGIDKLWRKRAVKILAETKPKKILDVASGTADFALETVNLNPDKIIGIDLSEKMLAIGRKKIEKKNLGHIIQLQEGDCEALPFADNIFDAVTVGFGVRNFMNPLKGLKEMNRVLKPGGMLVVLEFSKPGNFLVAGLFNFYFRKFCPFIGGIVSKDKSAYKYLQFSVEKFADGKEFLAMMEAAGFMKPSQQKLTFGIASIYCGTK